MAFKRTCSVSLTSVNTTTITRCQKSPPTNARCAGVDKWPLVRQYVSWIDMVGFRLRVRVLTLWWLAEAKLVLSEGTKGPNSCGGLRLSQYTIRLDQYHSRRIGRSSCPGLKCCGEVGAAACELPERCCQIVEAARQVQLTQQKTVQRMSINT